MKKSMKKHTIKPAKPPPSDAAQIEISVTSSIAAVTIVVITYPFFPRAKDSFRLSSIYVPRKPSPVTTNYIHLIVEICSIELT